MDALTITDTLATMEAKGLKVAFETADGKLFYRKQAAVKYHDRLGLRGAPAQVKITDLRKLAGNAATTPKSEQKLQAEVATLHERIESLNQTIAEQAAAIDSLRAHLEEFEDSEANALEPPASPTPKK